LFGTQSTPGLTPLSFSSILTPFEISKNSTQNILNLSKSVSDNTKREEAKINYPKNNETKKNILFSDNIKDSTSIEEEDSIEIPSSSEKELRVPVENRLLKLQNDMNEQFQREKLQKKRVKQLKLFSEEKNKPESIITVPVGDKKIAKKEKEIGGKNSAKAWRKKIKEEREKGKDFIVESKYKNSSISSLETDSKISDIYLSDTRSVDNSSISNNSLNDDGKGFFNHLFYFYFF
jgi:hypothetical protein